MPAPMYRYQTGKNDEMVYSFYKLFYNSLARLNNVLAAAENLEGADVRHIERRTIRYARLVSFRFSQSIR